MATLLSPEFGFPQEWLPDETLFSLCSRYHRASGNRLASTTCRDLFGHPNQGSAHDFPARLNHFSAATGTALGSVAQIVEHHTMLSFYLRFASDALTEQVITAAGENSAGRLKFQLGLLTSRFRANHPLKACPMCMLEDEKNFATAYWHRQHQLPGLWMCPKHGCGLLSSDLKATGVSRFQWILPSWKQFQDSAPLPPFSSVQKLGSMVAAVSTREGLKLRPEVLSLAFRAELRRRELLKGATQRLKHDAAGISYLEFLKPLLSLEQLGAMPASISAACMDITRQICTKCSGVHPLRRLALAAWLFQDLDNLLAQSATVQMGTDCESESCTTRAKQTSPAAPHADHQRRFFSELSTGKSISGAAHAAGIDPTTAMAWSAAQGIATERRPKILKPDLKAQLVLMLRKGVGKNEAAAFGKISVQTITTLLRTEVGLHEAWKQAVFSNIQESNRRQWTSAISANPLSGVKAARLANPSTYAWLYRNDRDWLSARSADMAKIAHSGGVRADWDARDKELATLVHKTALRLATDQAVSRIKLSQLYQRIPELKAKLFKLDRLPLTKAAILRVLR